jgi:hypothetical protein
MTLAALLFAAALGAALMALLLWSAWHPERARCALCNARPTSSPVAVNAAHAAAKRGHHAASNGQPSAAAAGDPSP